MNTKSGSTIADIRARAAKAADLLDVCRYLPKAEALAALKADAERTHAQYPQYKGHWDNYRLCRVKKTIKTKMGVAFEKGDLAIMVEFEGSDIAPQLKGSLTVYSQRNGIDNTGLRLHRDVEEVS
jgi:hypothetical protein